MLALLLWVASNGESFRVTPSTVTNRDAIPRPIPHLFTADALAALMTVRVMGRSSLLLQPVSLAFSTRSVGS